MKQTLGHINRRSRTIVTVPSFLIFGDSVSRWIGGVTYSSGTPHWVCCSHGTQN